MLDNENLGVRRALVTDKMLFSAFLQTQYLVSLVFTKLTFMNRLKKN